MMQKPSTEERLAALRQRREKRPDQTSPLDPPTPDPQAQQSRSKRSPAATARYVTVGASTTAVVGLIGAFTGIAATEDATPTHNNLVEPSADWSATADGSGSIAVAADSAVVVVVVDSNGRPVELQSIDSAQHLAALLSSGQPIIEPKWLAPLNEAGVSTSASTNAPLASAVTSPAPQSVQTAMTSSAGTSVETQPSESQTQVPAQTATPQLTPGTTVAPAPQTPVAPAPETTVPIAQPAPVQLKLPTPAPSQGNSGGS
jgi:hypothetical protein